MTTSGLANSGIDAELLERVEAVDVGYSPGIVEVNGKPKADGDRDESEHTSSKGLEQMKRMGTYGFWNVWMGKLKQRWARFLGDDLIYKEGKEEELIGRIHQQHVQADYQEEEVPAASPDKFCPSCAPDKNQNPSVSKQRN